jgi:endonuclease-3
MAQRSLPNNQAAFTTFSRLLVIAELLEDAFTAPAAMHPPDASTCNNALAVSFPPTSQASPSLVDELVATILSQNTSDLNSSRAFANLKAKYPRWRAVIYAPTNELAESIRIGGLADQKVVRIQEILRTIADRSSDAQGEPSLHFLEAFSTSDALSYLCGFKGVGVKTAACVLMFGLERELCAVDTHIHRIIGRLGIFPPSIPTRSADEICTALQATFDAAQQRLGRKYPRGIAKLLHVNMIRLGKSLCTARVPHCERCPLAEECVFARTAR